MPLLFGFQPHGPWLQAVAGLRGKLVSGLAGLGRHAGIVSLAGTAVLAVVLRTPADQRMGLWTWLLMAPLCEEAFFRGLLHNALLDRLGTASRGRRWGVNGGVALAFGALHAASRDVVTGVAVVVPALLIGWAYGRSRRLSEAVGLHASLNLVWLAWGRPGSAALAALASGGMTGVDLLSIVQEWLA